MRKLRTLLLTLSLIFACQPMIAAADDAALQERIDAIGKSLQDAPPCDPNQAPKGCEHAVTTLTDFAIYFRFCPQFKNHQFYYTTKGNYLFTVSTDPTAGGCLLSINTNLDQKNSCVISNTEAMQLSAIETLRVISQYDSGALTGDQVDSYIKPIVRCIPETPPPPLNQMKLLSPNTEVQQ